MLRGQLGPQSLQSKGELQPGSAVLTLTSQSPQGGPAPPLAQQILVKVFSLWRSSLVNILGPVGSFSKK